MTLLASFCIFLLMSSVGSVTPDILPKFPVTINLDDIFKHDNLSISHLEDMIRIYGKKILENSDIYPSKNAETEKQRYLFAVLADLVENDNLPCVEKHMKPFHEVLRNHSSALDNFTKVMKIFITELNSVSGGQINLGQNEMLNKFFTTIFDDAKSIEKLSSDVSRIVSYKESVDISKANLPISVQCRYIATRSEVIENIGKKTNDLSGVVQLAESTIDLAQTVMQFLDKSTPSTISSRLGDLKRQLKFNARKERQFDSPPISNRDGYKWLNILRNIEKIVNIGAKQTEEP